MENTFKKWFPNNKVRWNKYLRKRHTQQKKLLTDAYIRKTLRYKYTNDFLLNNPQIIIEYRKKTIEKRKRLKKIKKAINLNVGTTN